MTTNIISVGGRTVQHVDSDASAGEVIVSTPGHFSLEPITFDEQEAAEFQAFMQRPSRATGKTYARVQQVD